MLAAPPKAGEQPKRARLAYRPALDGLRALAVVAVFAYHARLPWARAGFLGVDVFFVLSGYLITALLLVEHEEQGRIDLVRFWSRRARRLLPALVVLLAAVAVAVPVLASEQAHRLRGDLLAALGYVSNWRFILENQSYFEAAGRPPVLQHLWSLAVEEQFYLLWPVALVWALRRQVRRARRRAETVLSATASPHRLVRPLLLAAAASAVLMAVLHQPFADPSRVYYGTDTRATALLLGAALACATIRWHHVDDLHRRGRWALEAAGLLGLGGLIWAVSQVDEFDPGLYRGGFLAIAIAAAAVVASAARPGSRGVLTVVLGSRPLVWLGRRSYAVYLWFWPVLMLTRPHLDVPLSGLPLLALRAGLTVALAAASYRFIERPARAGALGRVWAGVRRARRERLPLDRRSVAWTLGLTVAVLCVGTGVAADRPRATAEASLNRRAAVELQAILQATRTTTTLAPTTVPPTSATPATVAVEPLPGEPQTTVTTAPALTVPPPLPVVTARVTAIGDSVLLGARPLLERQVEEIVIDAAVGRQLPEVLGAVRALRDSGALGNAVILQTGNNGPISREQFDQLLELCRGVPKVLVVNVKVDRAWESHNNQVMAAAVPNWPNAVLVDWHASASDRADAFYDDGLHLTGEGMTLFAQLILAALQ